MKERPLPFSALMVCATLAGEKTQTRRTNGLDYFAQNDPDNWKCVRITDGFAYFVYKNSPVERAVRCPYGHPGDQLWVREAWRAPAGIFDSKKPRDIRPGTPIRYEADGCNTNGTFSPGRYRPPMFMPRWFSRITLDVIGISVERLHDISRGDAMDEGCPFPNMAQGDDPRKWYAQLWESLNGSGSWEANPWVWVIEFRKIP